MREYLKAHIYNERWNLPNNFASTLPYTAQIVKATKMFRKEYIMDFVNTQTLGVQYEDIDERVLEYQIVENIRKFILTFGDDVIFMSNQYRIAVAGEGLFIDLLFFNRDIGIILCRKMNKAFVEIAIQDFNKPMGVATYRTSEGMPEKYQKALPDIDELRRILESEE